jgi:hypothetical protein
MDVTVGDIVLFCVTTTQPGCFRCRKVDTVVTASPVVAVRGQLALLESSADTIAGVRLVPAVSAIEYRLRAAGGVSHVFVRRLDHSTPQQSARLNFTSVDALAAFIGVPMVRRGCSARMCVSACLRSPQMPTCPCVRACARVCVRVRVRACVCAYVLCAVGWFVVVVARTQVQHARANLHRHGCRNAPQVEVFGVDSSEESVLTAARHGSRDIVSDFLSACEWMERPRGLQSPGVWLDKWSSLKSLFKWAASVRGLDKQLVSCDSGVCTDVWSLVKQRFLSAVSCTSPLATTPAAPSSSSLVQSLTRGPVSGLRSGGSVPRRLFSRAVSYAASPLQSQQLPSSLSTPLDASGSGSAPSASTSSSTSVKGGSDGFGSRALGSKPRSSLAIRLLEPLLPVTVSTSRPQQDGSKPSRRALFGSVHAPHRRCSCSQCDRRSGWVCSPCDRDSSLLMCWCGVCACMCVCVCVCGRDSGCMTPPSASQPSTPRSAVASAVDVDAVHVDVSACVSPPQAASSVTVAASSHVDTSAVPALREAEEEKEPPRAAGAASPPASVPIESAFTPPAAEQASDELQACYVGSVRAKGVKHNRVMECNDSASFAEDRPINVRRTPFSKRVLSALMEENTQQFIRRASVIGGPAPTAGKRGQRVDGGMHVGGGVVDKRVDGGGAGKRVDGGARRPLQAVAQRGGVQRSRGQRSSLAL